MARSAAWGRVARAASLRVHSAWRQPRRRWSQESASPRYRAEPGDRPPEACAGRRRGRGGRKGRAQERTRGRRREAFLEVVRAIGAIDPSAGAHRVRPRIRRGDPSRARRRGRAGRGRLASGAVGNRPPRRTPLEARRLIFLEHYANRSDEDPGDGGRACGWRSRSGVWTDPFATERDSQCSRARASHAGSRGARRRRRSRATPSDDGRPERCARPSAGGRFSGHGAGRAYAAADTVGGAAARTRGPSSRGPGSRAGSRCPSYSGDDGPRRARRQPSYPRHPRQRSSAP